MSGRTSGRAASALREVRIVRGFTRHAEGSVLIECGDTRVLCTASIEAKVPGFLKGAGQGWLIGRSLRSVFDLTLLGERTITLDCDVLQADGGTRCASITGAFVAACDAVASLLRAGAVARTPIRDQVAAVSVGIVGGHPVLDLDYGEDSGCDTDLNVVMTGRGGFVEVQGTAEGEPFSRLELDTLIALAAQGIGELVSAQRSALGADHPALRV